MRDFWDALPVLAQDFLILAAWLIPVIIIAAIVLWGHRPWPLTRAMLLRFRWANVMFLLLIAISVGIGVGLIAQERGLRFGTAKAAEKFDLIISAPGSEITMMLAAVYVQPADAPLLGGQTYHEIATHPQVDIAAPLAYGDSYAGAPIVGTTAAFVEHLSDGQIEGESFGAHFDAVIGADVALERGDVFIPAHGFGDSAESDAHGAEGSYTVTGRMARTGSPWDKAILVPAESVWEIHGLANGHAPERANQLGPPFDPKYFPGTPAVIVRPKELWAAYALRQTFTREAETMAFFPGAVLARLHGLMGDVREAMSLISIVSQILVAASVMTGLMILTRLFSRQLAVLTAIGAPASASPLDGSPLKSWGGS